MAIPYQANFDSFQLPVKTGRNRRKKKLLKLFMRLKKAHQYYKLYSNDPIKRQQVIDGSGGLMDELERHGVHRSLSEALLFFGKEFVDYEFGEKRGKDKRENIISKAEEIFGVKRQPMTFGERRIFNQVKDKALVYTVKDGKPEILLYKTLQKGGIPLKRSL